MRLNLFCRLLIVFLAACQIPTASLAAAQADSQKGAREELSIDLASLMRPWQGDLDGMIERRLIRVLVVPSKTQFFNDKGTQRGATYDGFRILEGELNKKLEKEGKLVQKNLKVRFVFVPVGRDTLLQDLAAGKGDIAAANLTITPERQKLVDFTRPILSNASEVVLTGPASPALATLDDLAGKDVFVRKSSSYYESLLALNRRLAAERKPAVILKTAPEELEDEDLIEMLNAGLISCIVVDKHKADFWKRVFPKIMVRSDMVVRSGGEIAWAVRKGSPQLKATLDEFATAATTGRLVKEREQIFASYLKSTRFVKNAASEKERKKFLALIDQFRKYGDQYDVDWLLMAAQGYQESALNQNARSAVGAIGVMQIMPATGRDLKVGDIRKVEPNVHGGIKYMRWMIDNYYGDEPMTQLDKALFSFASYNAGPGRVKQLRQEAARRGLNPNVWFHNVEYIAAEKIGHETVTYVSNIYKYYIAYKLIMEAQSARQKAIQTIKTNK
jgi:membrane-bound lytic murein transglycosylase MltF